MPYGAKYKKSIHTVYLEQRQAAELKMISEATHLSANHLIREAIDLWLMARRAGKRTTVKPLDPQT